MANCWKCGRYLGVKDEWKKMKTEKGDICYVCYHKAKESAEEQIQKDMDKIIKNYNINYAVFILYNTVAEH